MKQIEILELEQIFQKVIEKLKFEEIDCIELETDLYRIIPTDSWNDFQNEVILLGSLEDDIEEIKKTLQNNGTPFTYVDFDRLASLLRYISQKYNP